MIKVLVAEDEPPIMRTIITSIETTNSKFKVTATSINGMKAIEILKNEPIDVVFTDIRMPVKDGLELAEWIRNNMPNVLVVMISGYQDFEYARAALKYKVYDYLLKPLSSDKLTTLLSKLEKDIEYKQEQLKKEFLQNTIAGKSPQLPVDTDCSLVLVCAGAYPVHGYDTLMPANKFWNEIDTQKIIGSLMRENENHILFNSNSQSERFIVLETNRKTLINDIYKAFLNDKIAITLIYKCDIKLSQSGKYFKQLSECLTYNLRLGVSQIICCDDTHKNTVQIKPPYSRQQIASIINSAKAGETDKVSKYLATVFDDMNKAESTQEDVLTFLNLLINYDVFDNINIKSIKNELSSAVAGFTDYKSLCADITSILSSLKVDDKPDMPERNLKLIDDVEQYLINNYSKSITNETLSKEFGFVPSYISRLFRQSKGVSPSEYLMHYRIELAKSLLSEKNDLMIKEIADMVGFKESYYFSKTFKKETGVWPSEYHG